jgi:3-hydroxybutyryl-CoA dehydrogenase
MKRVTVIGAGTMGHGIAHVASLAGYDTVLQDAGVSALESGLARIRSTMEKGVSLGKLELEAMQDALGRLRGVSDLAEAVADADLVVEAVPESMELKSGLLQAIEAQVPDHTILASNTSSLSIDALGSVLAVPGTVPGAPLLQPRPHHGPGGGGARPPDLGDGAGGRGNLRPQPGEGAHHGEGFPGLRIVAAGGGPGAGGHADAGGGGGFRGGYRPGDGVGLPTPHGTAAPHGPGGAGRPAGDRPLPPPGAGGEHFRPPAILERLVEEGKLGKKSGRGFYDWEAP